MGVEFAKDWLRSNITPSGNGNDTTPRSEGPSWSRRDAWTVPPHGPDAVNMNGRATGAPPPGNAPYTCDGPGDKTPPDSRSVATRFVVIARPTFCSEKFTVTRSPGSTTPLAGEQFSAITAVPASTSNGLPAFTVTRAV